MARIMWDENGKKFYEAGTCEGVVYPMGEGNIYGQGKPWNGLTAVKRSSEGGEPNDLYANNNKYISIRSAEQVKGTIEAFTYPDEFSECDGSKQYSKGVRIGQQVRKPFGLVYSTLIGSDTKGLSAGKKIHILYECTARPSNRDYETINKDPDAIKFSWEFDTVPQSINDKKFTKSAYLEIDTRTLPPEKLTVLEKKLYGDASGEATLPGINELLELIK